jgi:phage minor structural protein
MGVVPTLCLFDRWDERLGVLPTLGAMTHAEELGGEDMLELDCLLAPEKGDRLVWRDPETGAWREHEVVRTDEATGTCCHVYAESSLCELLRDYVVEEQLVARTAAQAMSTVLGVTRWSLGDVTVDDTKRGALLYHTNALAGLRRVESVWGGELECSYEVAEGKVSKRTVSLLERRGGWHGARFSYAHNLVGCTRTVLEDEVFTALYGWGKGLPIEDEEGNATGGYT